MTNYVYEVFRDDGRQPAYSIDLRCRRSDTTFDAVSSEEQLWIGAKAAASSCLYRGLQCHVETVRCVERRLFVWYRGPK